MKKIMFAACLVALGVLFNSCATMFSGRTQNVSFSSTPPGAFVKDNRKGEVLCVTPCVAETPRSRFRTLTFEKEGYVPLKKTIKGGFNPTVLWNLLTVYAVVIGTPIDYATGAAWKYKNPNVSVSLDQTGEYVADPTMRAGEANRRVTRENPGGTALERTIIRWHFDSEPRGSRIFWRVISSIPDEVKNTNELYLTTTPYEETRSFNILGLTYQNSRDVTIEIKVTKAGYEDQVKRYNVRQAIDQQEISGFFELVRRSSYN